MPGRYVTLRSEPIPIEVTKAARLASRDIIASGGRPGGNSKEIEAQQGGIFANITDPNQLGDDRIRPERWLAGLGGLAAGYVALAFVVGRWRRLSGDTAMLRRRAAVGVARRRLREASSHFAAGRTREGADQVLAAALGLVADMLALPAAGMTSAEACRQLEAAGVQAELVGRLRSLLETCEGVRYGGSADASESLGREADKLLRTLAGVLRKKRRLPVFQAAILLMVAARGRMQPIDRLPVGPEVPIGPADVRRRPKARGNSPRRPCSTRKSSIAGGRRGRCCTIKGMRGCGRANPAGPWHRIAWRSVIFPVIRASTPISFRHWVPMRPRARRPVAETILFWQNWLSYPEKFYLEAALALATFAVAAGSLFTARRWPRRVAWMGLALTGVMALSVAYDWQRFDNTQHGVVIRAKTIAKRGTAPATNRRSRSRWAKPPSFGSSSRGAIGC